MQQQGGAWFFTPTGAGEKYFSFTGQKSVIKAYEKCPPVASIINRKAQAFSNGKIYILDKEGKDATGDISDRLRKLFKRPNPLQTWKQFDMQGYIYQQSFGYCPVLAIKPTGFKENWRAKSIWNIPPNICKIKERSAIFFNSLTADEMVESITINYKDQKTTLEMKDVLILRDITPSMHTVLLPESRLKALSIVVNNIIGALESRNVLINYRGALGILSPEKDQFGVAPIDPDDKEELQKDFLRYGLKDEQWKFIISSAALKWQSIGIPTKDLMLIEEVAECTKMLCDGYNYPPHLMGLLDPTFNNQNTAEKGLYQNTIMPESDSNYEQWNDFFFGVDNTGELVIWKDFSHLPVLQEDRVQLATARRTLNEAKKIEWDNDLITLNQWLEALDEPPLDGDAGNVRRSEIPQTSGPLAAAIGVGGVQGLIAVITAPGMSPEAKAATIEIVFGISPPDAARMVEEGTPPATTIPPTNGVAATGAPAAAAAN